MALQTKTFAWGSYAYQSESNAYVLELTLTEQSVSYEKNTSQVAYALVLKSGAQNRFTGDVDSVLKLNGSQVSSGTKRISAAYNSSWTLLSGETAVTHNDDGSLNMPIQVSINTYNSYAPPDKTLSWAWDLTDIPRASAIAGVTGDTLGSPITVQIERASQEFTHTLWYRVEASDWSEGLPTDTQAIFTPPLELCRQIPGGSGRLTLRLRTFQGKTQIGEDVQKDFRVYVPDCEATKPVVTVTLGSDFSPAPGLFVQGKSRLQGQISAQDPYGAAITELGMLVDGVAYTGPEAVTPVLTTSGTIAVTGYAVNAREHTGKSQEQTLPVLPYDRPRIQGVTAVRCGADGAAKEDGTYLQITATRVYSPALWEGQQYNFCEIRFCYQAEGAPGFSDWETILPEEASVDTVVTKPLLEGRLDATKNYVVRIGVKDTFSQETAFTTQVVPSQRVYLHRKAGGNAMGLGGYAQGDDLLDVYWNQRIRKDLTVDGSLQVGDEPFLERVYPVGSIYMSVVDADPAALFGGEWERLKDRFLLAAGDTYAPGSMGGAAEHVLTVEEMPRHNHAAGGVNTTAPQTGSSAMRSYDYSNLTGETGVVSSTGGDQPHNNMPPYLAVYMYRRTA